MVSPALSIDIISDLVCPWCFIGKRRLQPAEVLLDAMGQSEAGVVENQKTAPAALS